MKICHTLLCDLNVFKKDPNQESVFAMGVIPVHLKILLERYYQAVEKEEDNLYEQEENIFDYDKDDTITLSG